MSNTQKPSPSVEEIDDAQARRWQQQSRIQASIMLDKAKKLYAIEELKAVIDSMGYCDCDDGHEHDNSTISSRIAQLTKEVKE